PMDSPINRRRFLKAGAAVAATASVAGLPTLSEAADSRYKKQDNDPFGGFTVGVQSYTFRQFKLEQCLVQTQKLGLRHIEFYNGHVPLTSPAAHIRALLTLRRDHGVPPAAFGVETSTKHPDPTRRKFDFARSLGVRSLSADPSPDSFDSLDKLVAEYNINIA